MNQPTKEVEGTWEPFVPVNLGNRYLAFKTKAAREEFLKHCTNQGTLFTGNDGRTLAVQVLVYDPPKASTNETARKKPGPKPKNGRRGRPQKEEPNG